VNSGGRVLLTRGMIVCRIDIFNDLQVSAKFFIHWPWLLLIAARVFVCWRLSVLELFAQTDIWMTSFESVKVDHQSFSSISDMLYSIRHL
jgi:hypothetical protein